VLPGELLCEAVDVHPGEKVLAVAAGNGATSLAASRRWADVTATDSVADILEPVRRVAEAYDLPLRTQVADARALPFDDDAFDVVLSAFGAMFLPDQQRMADELVRVCRPAGRIGLRTCPSVSLIADVLRAADEHVPEDRNLSPAVECASENRLRELFGNAINALRLETRPITFRYRSLDHMLEWFRSGYQPTKVVFESLDGDDQAALAADLIDIHRRYNRADDGTLVASSDYVEVVAVVR
jgi:SAM-dependent methyltransferase